MKTVKLWTHIDSNEGTFGQLDVEGFSFFTCEDDDWQVPAGTYPLRLTQWHAHEDTPVYMICDVPGHDRIYLHYGNTEEDTAHCVLLGLQLGFLRVAKDEELGTAQTKLAVLQSRKAFEKFMQLMGGDGEATIEIRRNG